MAKNSSGEDGIGYGRPPAHGRFKPGQSGNPRGRPRGSKNTVTRLNEILEKTVVVGKGKSKRRMTNEDAMLEKWVEKAIAGDPKARKDLMEYREKKGPSETSPQKASPEAKIIVYRIPDNGRLMDPSVIVESPGYDFEVEDSAPDTGKE